MNGKIKHTNKKMGRPRQGVGKHSEGACGGPAAGRREGALPSVLVLLLLYIFRRLPTRFSFHALRLAASREQKRGKGGKERKQKKGEENK